MRARTIVDPWILGADIGIARTVVGRRCADNEAHAYRRLLMSSSVDGAAAVSAVPLALENPHVGSAEGRVTQRVAHRVHSTVDVAKVIKKVPQLLRYVPRAGGEGLEEYQDVVRGPRDDEREQDRRERLRGLTIGLLLLYLLLLLVWLLVQYTLAARCFRHVLRVQWHPDVWHLRRPPHYRRRGTRHDVRAESVGLAGPAVPVNVDVTAVVLAVLHHTVQLGRHGIVVDHLYGRPLAILTAVTRQFDHNRINLEMEEAQRSIGQCQIKCRFI